MLMVRLLALVRMDLKIKAGQWLLVHKVMHCTVLLCLPIMDSCRIILLVKGHNRMVSRHLRKATCKVHLRLMRKDKAILKDTLKVLPKAILRVLRRVHHKVLHKVLNTVLSMAL